MALPRKKRFCRSRQNNDTLLPVEIKRRDVKTPADALRGRLPEW